jgi:hypothetical protein
MGTGIPRYTLIYNMRVCMPTITLPEALLLFACHLIGDFFLQTRKMATNKSTSNAWLVRHVTVYSLCFFWAGIIFMVLNGLFHYATDYVSSRGTSHFYKKNNMYGFFAVIGTDQYVHKACLLVLYVYTAMPIWSW